MIALAALTVWIGTGASLTNAFRPQVVSVFNPPHYEDLTGQASNQLLTAPNVGVVRLSCTRATALSINADSRFWVVAAYVFDPSDPDPVAIRDADSIPGATERTNLISKLVGFGLGNALATGLVGTTFTRRQIAGRIIVWANQVAK